MIRMHTVGPLLRAAGLTADRTAAAVIVAVVLLFAWFGLAHADNTFVLSSNNATPSSAKTTITIAPPSPASCPATLGLVEAAARFDGIADRMYKRLALTGVLSNRAAAVDADYLRQMARCLRETAARWGIP